MKEVVRNLCFYIQNSIKRPKVEHKRELHSGIVAAFRCLAKWLDLHSELLADSSFLYFLMEILELGISGSRSRQANGLDINKNQKVNEPVSGRVRHAAEELLSLLFKGTQKDSLIDESCLGEENLDFYLLYGNCLVTIHEVKNQPKPSMIMILRHPGGRAAWQFENRLGVNDDPVTEYEIAQRVTNIDYDTEFTPYKRAQLAPIETVPPGVSKIPTTQADFSIPTAEEVAERADVHNLKQINQIRALLEEQIKRENEALKAEETAFTPTQPPPPVSSFKSSRLLFSHLGLLGIDSVTRQSNPSDNSDLIRLRGSGDLLDELRVLDQMPHSHHDSCFVFYVRAGKYTKEEIYSSALGRNRAQLDPNFIDLLFSLGTATSVDTHPYWSGSVKSSYRIGLQKKVPPNELDLEGRGTSCFNGESHLLYWADGHNEIAFLVPSLAEPSEVSFQMGMDESTESHSISSSVRRTGSLTACDSRTLVVWLEDLDDMDHIPADMLSTESTTGEEPVQDPSFIFIHPLRNGLYRITVRASHNVKGHPAPIVSGSVISKRVLGPLLRETIVNHGNRRRLDSDAHTHPNHRRSRKIQEIKERFQDNQVDHRFYSQIIQDVPNQDLRRGSAMSAASQSQSIDLHI